MDRRQLLFGATALGLATNLKLNHPLIVQGGEATMGSGRLSDRERAGLRGPVKTCSDFMRDAAESMTEEEYTADGRLLVWRGRILSEKVERVNAYDATGRVIGVTGGGADVNDEFLLRREQGRKDPSQKCSSETRLEGIADGWPNIRLHRRRLLARRVAVETSPQATTMTINRSSRWFTMQVGNCWRRSSATTRTGG